MLQGIAIGELTPSVLLGMCVLLIFLGRLVPRSSLQDKIKEAEQWRLAYETERKAHDVADKQTTRLIEQLSKITNGLFSSIGSPSDGNSP